MRRHSKEGREPVKGGRSKAVTRHTKAEPTSVPTAPHLTPFHPIRAPYPVSPIRVRTAHGDSFDHLVGGCKQRWRHIEAEGLGGLEVDDQFKLDWCLDRKIGRLFPFEDAIDVGSATPEDVHGIRRI